MSTDTTVPNPPPRTRSRRGLIALVLGLALLVAVVVLGISVRANESRELKTWTNAQALPSVNLITPGVQPQGPVLNLPGRMEAYSRASIFARVNGYLKSWKVDIGAHVKAGQLLAEIDTPELDQQLLQARANLASAQANATLAQTTAKRWQAMLASDSVSRQDVDERTGDLAAKLANVKSAQASVEQLVATKGFQRLTAPFDGVVTARSTDVGALISAGGSAGRELFAVSDVSRLRVYVQVPQTFSPQIRIGTTARLTVPEYRKESFNARVIATADAVTAASGSTLVQLLVDNPGGRLLPGGYTSVQFDLPVQADVLRLPASALVFDEHGMRVATLDKNDHVLFKTISIARDFGDTVEIGSGLDAGDRVIDTPPDGLGDNDAVRVEAKPHG
ncbi:MULTISPECIES: efflux RND transporter periplasmic adaptor subunit [Pseudomonas]|uniref:efflux RND transporter periplasmic adaptor subunit n=1 Tax=Pseudomonas TaxID=286 RepID=UPI000CD53D73|nr:MULTISPECIES: efflux RND transporter periplasmic adaptor subunit [Pseudomonas]RBH56726.1 efflux RND transporter periplasmic adaptor subunit [Pseudomonas sp. MWU13-2860]